MGNRTPDDQKQLPSAFQRTVFGSYTRLRPGIFVNRPVRTRIPVENPDLSGVVWGPGVKIPRLPDYTIHV